MENRAYSDRFIFLIRFEEFFLSFTYNKRAAVLLKA